MVLELWPALEQVWVSIQSENHVSDWERWIGITLTAGAVFFSAAAAFFVVIFGAGLREPAFFSVGAATFLGAAGFFGAGFVVG